VIGSFVPDGLPSPIWKNPSPWMATSSGLPVVWTAPLVIRLSIEPRPTPRPTWAPLEPPVAVVAPAAPRWSWFSESENVTRADL
jgi:hypothetical protein